MANLRISWQAINARAAGTRRQIGGEDGETIEGFAAHTDSFLHSISRELRTGNFKFSPLRAVLIKKPNGKDRLICVPTVRDRVVQGALLGHLAKDNRYGLDNGVSFGFIRGQGVKKAALQAKCLRDKLPFAYKTDITSFFDNVPRSSLSAILHRKITEKSLWPLLDSAMACEVAQTTGQKQRRIKALGVQVGKGVRQGMPLSPFFANLVLSPFDKEIIKHNFEMVRYADDLIFFSDSQSGCIQIHSFCKEELMKLGLEIPEVSANGETKTQIYLPDRPAEFLGVGLVPSTAGYRLEIMPSQTESLKRDVLQLANLDELVNRGIDITGFFRRLNSVIAGYEGSYHFCDNFGALKDMLASLRTEVLQTLFSKGLGVRLSSLTQKQRAFLKF